MSRSGEVTVAWADGEYRFRLGWGEIEHIQEACDAGPFVVLDRLRNGSLKTQDVVTPIMQGLLGGGMDVADARKLVDLWVRKRPLAESILTAQAVLAAALYGAEDEPVEEFAPGKPEREARPTSRMARSGSRRSTASAPPAASAPPR